MAHLFTLVTSLHLRSVHDFEDRYAPHDISFVSPPALAPSHMLVHDLRQRRKMRSRCDAVVKMHQRVFAHTRIHRQTSRAKYLNISACRYTRVSRCMRVSIDPSQSPQSFTSRSFAPSNLQSSSASSGHGSSSRPPPLGHTRSYPRIRVASLLSNDHPKPHHYHLEVIQHPEKTAEFRNASLSRLPLTPPLVARLTVSDARGTSFVPEDELPFLISHLSLYPAIGGGPYDANWQSEQGPPTLYGNLVSAVDVLEDLQGNMGLFFLFPDVSIRWKGNYRVRVSLLKIGSPFSTDSSGHVRMAETTEFLTSVDTHPFEVVPQDQYIALGHTRLTQAFLRQGARMFSFLPQT